MKKLLVSMLLLVLIFSIAPNVSNASYRSNCSYAGIECQRVEMYRDEASASTNQIWFNKGDLIKWGAKNNYSDGQFQVGISLWNWTLLKRVDYKIIPYGVQPTFRKFCTLSKIRYRNSQIPVR